MPHIDFKLLTARRVVHLTIYPQLQRATLRRFDYVEIAERLFLAILLHGHMHVTDHRR